MGTSFIFGVAGNEVGKGIAPLLKGTTEHSIFYFSTQAGLSVSAQVANKKLNQAYGKEKK